jgi:hypothetical protein
MTQFYFHCSNTKKVFADLRGAAVNDLAEARDYAARVVQCFTNERSLEDWRDWILHISDDQGDELFVCSLRFRARQAVLKSPCLQLPRAPIGRSFAARQIRAYWTIE